jgi:predicted molibdopterin-dependent oxidoreductase YjgC
MFRSIASNLERPTVTLDVQGQPVTARVGDTLAMALLNAGIVAFRQTPVSGQPRAPLCLMGGCFDCLVEVNGQQNVQSCMVEVSEGMQVRLPDGARRAAAAV